MTSVNVRAVALAAILVLVLWSDSAFVNARGGRGGGARGGRSTGGSRYTSRSSSGYVSRSRGGHTYTSSYISYRPAVRYTRVYLSYYNSYYYSYYNMYFYYSGTHGYVHRQRPSGSTYVCANYEANSNGTTMGIFTCPNSWEPNSFKYCCGQDYAEYCCEKSPTSWTTWFGVAIAIIVVIVIIVYIVLRVKKYGSCCGGPTVTQRTTVITSTTNTGQDSGTNGLSYGQDSMAYQPPTYPGPYMKDEPHPDPNNPYSPGAYPVQPPSYDNPAYGANDNQPKVAPPAYEAIVPNQPLGEPTQAMGMPYPPADNTGYPPQPTYPPADQTPYPAATPPAPVPYPSEEPHPATGQTPYPVAPSNISTPYPPAAPQEPTPGVYPGGSGYPTGTSV